MDIAPVAIYQQLKRRNHPVYTLKSTTSRRRWILGLNAPLHLPFTSVV